MIPAGVPILSLGEGDFADAARGFEGIGEGADARKVVAHLAHEGFTAVVAPPSRQVDVATLCAARAALAYHSALADSVLACIGLGCQPLMLAGGETAERWLAPTAAGEACAGFALTEPEAGSDVAGMQARAERYAGGYKLSGRKTFISNAPIADWFVVFARAEGGPAAFVIERGDGLRVILDVPLSAPHPIGSLALDEVVIGESRRLGQEGDGIKLALATLDLFRASVGAAACGMAQRALDETVAHVKARRQFGKPLADFQLTQARLAECATELAAAKGLVAHAAAQVAGRTSDAKLAVAMAKLHATEAAGRIVDAAVQLHGGLGVTRGVKVEELYREVRALRIYEGTSEIQKLIIARELLRR
jgi:acyl-CoA dehydrogenase